MSGVGGSGVRLVVFDWGGVLVRICRGWAEACERAGVAYRGEPAGLRSADPLRVEAGSLSRMYQSGGLDCGAYFERAAASNGEYTREELERVHDAWIIGEYEGAGVLVDALRGLGVETGLLSNTNARHWARRSPVRRGDAWLACFPTAGRLAHQHASHLLGAVKPEAAVYERFERATGCRGGEIVFFDDLPENVEAAAARGWRAFVVDHAGDPVLEMRGVLARLLDAPWLLAGDAGGGGGGVRA